VFFISYIVFISLKRFGSCIFFHLEVFLVEVASGLRGSPKTTSADQNPSDFSLSPFSLSSHEPTWRGLWMPVVSGNAALPSSRLGSGLGNHTGLVLIGPGHHFCQLCILPFTPRAQTLKII
jgi:hypothetical protein